MNTDEMTAAEAADELGLTLRGVQYRLKRSILTGRLVAGRVWLIPRAEVDRAKREGRLPPGPRRKPREGRPNPG